MGLLKDFKYHPPATLKEALSILGKAKNPLILGGGTSVLNYLKKASRYPTDVISLKKITELCGIKSSAQGLSIGAMTTISELAQDQVLEQRFTSLHQACQKLATTPVRNMATIGGNLASRFFWVDLPAVLISLGAKVVYVSKKGKKTVSVEEFLKDRDFKKSILTSTVCK